MSVRVGAAIGVHVAGQLPVPLAPGKGLAVLWQAKQSPRELAVFLDGDLTVDERPRTRWKVCIPLQGWLQLMRLT